MRRGRDGGLPQRASDQDPTYVRGRQRSEFIAHFSSGATVQVELGRRRRYPGLDGPAPHTQLCYRNLAALAPRASQIVDVGCGAGVGLRWLLHATTARLIGIDCDGKAVAFAREYVPEVEFIHADAESYALPGAGCIALIVDVLGMVFDPVKLLRSTTARINHPEAVFIAEPEANEQQQLLAPVRRAFSPQMLVSLLVRAGYAVDQLERLECGILCAVAHPSHDRASQLLKDAEQAYLLHQSQPMLSLCTAARNSGNIAVEAEAMLLEASLRFDLGQRDRAIAVLSDACALIPHDARPIAGLARLALATGNQERAVQLAEQAVEVDPAEPSALCSLALVYASEQHSRSLQAWTAASALVPDDCLVAQMAYAAAFTEGRHVEGLALVERLSQYQGLTTHVNEHAGLAGLIAGVRRQYLNVRGLADSLGAMQPDARV